MSLASKVAAVAVFGAIVGVPMTMPARHRATPPPVVHLVVPPEPVQIVEADPRELRVCADPNNLPFSNARGEGFENAIATLIAGDLGKTVSYFWLPQRRGFVRNSLNAGVCDVIIGVPEHYELVRTTRPYYRSSFVFVTSRRHRPVGSFDDPSLRSLSIGIQITGDDYDNPAPAVALAARHLTSKVRGYPVYGDYSQPAPQREVIDDVSAGRIDAAIVWGPIAGYFANRSGRPLRLTPVSPASDPEAGPFTFAIAMGVRRNDAALQHRLDEVLSHRRAVIERLLRQFGVPLVDEGAGP